MSDVLKFQRGIVLLFSVGEYSDFGYCGQLVTLTECDLPALAQQYVAAHNPKDEWDDKPRCEDFASWLVANGHCAPLACETVHIGSYGDFEEELVPRVY